MLQIWQLCLEKWKSGALQIQNFAKGKLKFGFLQNLQLCLKNWKSGVLQIWNSAKGKLKSGVPLILQLCLKNENLEYSRFKIWRKQNWNMEYSRFKKWFEQNHLYGNNVNNDNMVELIYLFDMIDWRISHQDRNKSKW